MLIDIVFLVLMVLAIIKGYSKGFAVAAFSFLGIIIGLAVAVKCSALVASQLKSYTHIQVSWIPFIAFLITMLGVWILVRLGAKLIEASLNMVMLGWLNSLAGILLYAILYTILLSILLFYADKLNLLGKTLIADSQVYRWIEPVGPKFIKIFSNVLPALKGAFDELTAFLIG